MLRKISLRIHRNQPFNSCWNAKRLVIKISIILLFIFAAKSGYAVKSTISNSPIRVLIIDGFSNHDWAHTTKLIRAILQEANRFEVEVATCPADINDPVHAAFRPKFDRYDVVIQTCNDLGNKGAWPAATRLDFEKFVRQGGGVFIFHAANNSFAAWPEYNQMIGLGWRNTTFPSLTIKPDGTIRRIPPGEGKATSHGARSDRVVHRLKNHPIYKGLPSAWMASMVEVYTYPRGPAKRTTVLSWAEDPATKTNWPIEWTVSYGKGRVYSSTMGHVWLKENNPSGIRCAGFQTIMVRAIQWLAKRRVDFPVPSDFPSETEVKLRTLVGESAFDISSPSNGKELTQWSVFSKELRNKAVE